MRNNLRYDELPTCSLQTRLGGCITTNTATSVVKMQQDDTRPVAAAASQSTVAQNIHCRLNCIDVCFVQVSLPRTGKKLFRCHCLAVNKKTKYSEASATKITRNFFMAQQIQWRNSINSWLNALTNTSMDTKPDMNCDIMLSKNKIQLKTL